MPITNTARNGILLSCITLLIAASVPCLGQKVAGFLTDYEKSGFKASPDYAATLAFARRIEKASPWIRLTSFGVSSQGRELPLIVLSKDRAFTPARARNTGKPIVLVQSGIHAGEIDGKDASLMLLREIAVTKSLARLADNAVILFMPIFNVDGHERRGPFNRINQNGPEETGWRVTARNLNLNRDFLKADAPEMRAWLRAFNAWLPDLVIDIHVTDGIDFQYNLTWSMEMNENASPAVVAWQKELRDSFVSGMASRGDPVCCYVWPREDKDLSKGLLAGAAGPRFSTGYVAIRNRAALLVETHMLKTYKDRVTATYRLLIEVLDFVNRKAGELRRATKMSDEETAKRFSSSSDTARFPLSFRTTDASHQIEFLGYESEVKKSAVSGGEYQVWHHDKPVKISVPLFDQVAPAKTVVPPKYYLIPAEWTECADILRLHGVVLARLRGSREFNVETYVFSKPKWRETPYEGRHTVDTRIETSRGIARFPAGTWVVRLDQPSARAAIHLLEPEGPDSFVSWGFFNAIFEQKEYFENYVMEDIAASMILKDKRLEAGFMQRVAQDSTFARDPRARLNFFYEKSPWSDKRMNLYPVARCMEAIPADMLLQENRVPSR
jgi:hypothetical protein